ncbi:MAG: biotin attachment protein [Candidatus Atribacteria bacterium]|nr:biotin attachment protein [Candidatus Atribacteria bacterium]
MQIPMPKYGQTMEEGEIVKWRKKVGDSVKKGEVYLEIASDKTELEVESEYTGVMSEILVKEGAKVLCGTIIATIEV